MWEISIQDDGHNTVRGEYRDVMTALLLKCGEVR